MPLPQPINAHEASPEIQEIYDDIQSTFDLTYVPLMFRYLGNYPLFLGRLWPTIKMNAVDPTFKQLLATLQQDILRSAASLTRDLPEVTKVANQLISLEQETRTLHEVEVFLAAQLHLSFLAVAMRERTKGWAIGARLLPDASDDFTGDSSQKEKATLHNELHEIVIGEATSALALQEDIREPLIKFIVYMHEEFLSIVTKDSYVFTRVQCEKILMHHLTNIPHPLFASYNEVVKSMPDKREIANACYLLSEKFPVGQTVAALMWAVSVQVLKE